MVCNTGQSRRIGPQKHKYKFTMELEKNESGIGKTQKGTKISEETQ